MRAQTSLVDIFTFEDETLVRVFTPDNSGAQLNKKIRTTHSPTVVASSTAKTDEKVSSKISGRESREEVLDKECVCKQEIMSDVVVDHNTQYGSHLFHVMHNG